jgi:uncharacterized integral membrane protein
MPGGIKTAQKIGAVDAGGGSGSVTPSFVMNAKLIFKTLFLIAVALLLVLMGMHNKSYVSLALPPLLPRALQQPAAIMYIGFFAVGLLSGVILTAGGKKGGSGSGSKPK